MTNEVTLRLSLQCRLMVKGVCICDDEKPDDARALVRWHVIGADA
jgi:hypothetical protein